jgi:hypothetical protein
MVPTARPGFGEHRCRRGMSLDGEFLFGQTEVENLGVSAGADEEVRRLDIAMNDAPGVRRIERIGHLDRHFKRGR